MAGNLFNGIIMEYQGIKSEKWVVFQTESLWISCQTAARISALRKERKLPLAEIERYGHNYCLVCLLLLPILVIFPRK